MASSYKVNKRPAESFPIGFTYGSPDLETGETISTVTTACDIDGVINGSPTKSVDGKTVYQSIHGGSSGSMATVSFTVTTTTGKVYVDEIDVKII